MERENIQLLGYEDVKLEAKVLAEMNENVLISGETGVGKNAFAALIHSESERNDHRFVRVLCPAIQSNLFESELFGHRRGSFTDAREDRIGTVEYADGGTVYLDEIGNLAMDCQAKLHHVVDELRFKRVGENRERQADVRFLFATNRNLPRMVEEDQFMEDLYHRINTYHLNIPPLRERQEDLEIIARYYWRNACHGELSRHEVKLLREYPFPGNIRELQNLLKRVCFLWRKGTDEERTKLFIEEIERLKKTIHSGKRHSKHWSMVIFQRMIEEAVSFWDAVYIPYMNHDINKHQLREILAEGLQRVGGKWNRLLPLFHIETHEYKKFMDFVRHQGIRRPGTE